MNARKFLGSYLQKEDIPDPIIARVREAREETLEENERAKLILYFEEFEKGLVCNVTNINVLIDVMQSDETDNWIGKDVGLYVDNSVMFAGKRVGGIRCKAPGVPIVRTAPSEPVPIRRDAAPSPAGEPRPPPRGE